MDYILAEGKNYYDIADLHMFGELASIKMRVLWLQQKMKRRHYLKPIWSLAMAGPDLRVAEYTEDLQAQELVKRFLLGYAGGLEKIIYFHWQDAQTGQNNPLAATLGLNTLDGKSKPAKLAYKIMVDNLVGFTHLKKIEISGGVNGFQLSWNNKPPVFVLWSDKPIVVTLPKEIQANAKAINYLGDSIAIAKGKFNLGVQPIYILTNN